MPKRIFAFQSITEPGRVNFVTVLSMASCCSGRNTIGSSYSRISEGSMALRPSFAAWMAFRAVSRPHSNHSVPWRRIEKLWRFTPDRRRMLWTSLSLKLTNFPRWMDIVSSVCKSWYEMPAVFVYWSMRFLAAAFSALLFGCNVPSVASSRVVSPIFRQPLWASSLMAKI